MFFSCTPITDHQSLITVADAAVSTGTDKRLESSSTNQGGGTITSPRFRQQNTVGEAVAGSTISTARFRIVPGFLGATLATSEPVPPTDLDISVLYAKTDPLGQHIPAQTWQRDTDPVFIWDTPAAGLQVAGYSYAFDGVPDDVVDITATSLNLAGSPLGPLTDGKRTFSVKAVNTAGNSGNAASLEMWVDINPPQIGAYAPAPAGLLNTTDAAVSAVVSDAASGVNSTSLTLLINGQAASVEWSAAAGAMTSSGGGWKEGANSLELRAADLAGNAATPLIWSVTIDTVPPTGTLLINGGAEMTTSVHATLTLGATDATSGVDRIMLSNEEAAGYVEEPYVAQRDLWTLKAVRGIQQVFVKFLDKAGNMSSPVADAIELGLLSPDTVISGGPAGFSPERITSFSFLCPEGDCIFSYAFDNQEWSAWSADASATSPALVFGNHYFRVKAAKEANGLAGVQPDEEDPTPAERTWVVGVEPSTFAVPKGPPIKVWRIE